jgi:hypothetical protein
MRDPARQPPWKARRTPIGTPARESTGTPA